MIVVMDELPLVDRGGPRPAAPSGAPAAPPPGAAAPPPAAAFAAAPPAPSPTPPPAAAPPAASLAEAPPPPMADAPSPGAALPSPAPPARWRWVEGGVFLVALLALLGAAALWGNARERPDPARTLAVVVPPAGPASDFVLLDLAGRPVRLAELRGRVVLLNFWATWCAPCREEMPALEALARELGGQGLVVLTVNFEEAPETVRTFVREVGLTLPVLLDADGAVARRYRVTALPASFLVARDGALVGSVLGYRDWRGAAARAYLQGLLARG
jgi:thiol-disulfide isomerase/thioredoxin